MELNYHANDSDDDVDRQLLSTQCSSINQRREHKGNFPRQWNAPCFNPTSHQSGLLGLKHQTGTTLAFASHLEDREQDRKPQNYSRPTHPLTDGGEV